MQPIVVAAKIPPEIAEALHKRAAVERLSASAIVRRALMREFYDVPVTTVIDGRASRAGRPRKDRQRDSVA